MLASIVNNLFLLPLSLRLYEYISARLLYLYVIPETHYFPVMHYFKWYHTSILVININNSLEEFDHPSYWDLNRPTSLLDFQPDHILPDFQPEALMNPYSLNTQPNRPSGGPQSR